jgi:hypothetical protein
LPGWPHLGSLITARALRHGRGSRQRGEPVVVFDASLGERIDGTSSPQGQVGLDGGQAGSAEPAAMEALLRRTATGTDGGRNAIAG